jgi:hypothetical protein
MVICKQESCCHVSGTGYENHQLTGNQALTLVFVRAKALRHVIYAYESAGRACNRICKITYVRLRRFLGQLLALLLAQGIHGIHLARMARWHKARQYCG